MATQKLRNYQDLHVWQRAVAHTVAIYKVTKSFPKQELFGGLTDQIRRASVSIASNIAEGHMRHSDKAFANHLDIALGSAAELGTQLFIAMRIGYLSEDEHAELHSELVEVTRMLHALYRTVHRSAGS